VTTQQRNGPELLLGLGIMTIGLVIAWQAATIKVGPLYAKVGPAAFLWLSSGLLCLCGAIVAYKALTSSPETGNELRGPLIILAGLVASAFMMDVVGFVPTATVIFVTTANGLGSHKFTRDVLIGVALAIGAYLIFGLGLGLRLPIGSLFT
jgi:putative tricarboxylic transport membrane protein